MAGFNVEVIDTDIIADYRESLDMYYSDLVADNRSDVEITKHNLEVFVTSMLDRLKDNTIIFNKPIVEKGDRFRADEYNAAMREIYVDLLTAYNKLRALETTADNILSVIQFVRDNVLRNIEAQTIKVDVLKQMVDDKLEFDEMHVIENNVNEYPDSETACDVVNNTVTLGRISEDEINISTLYNNISLITFNTNVDIYSRVYKIDDLAVLNVAGKSKTTPILNTKLINNFNLQNSTETSKGMLLGINVDLSRPTLVNRIRLNSVSAARFRIIGVFYTALGIDDVNNFSPASISFKTNKYNIDDIDLILESTISARNIIIVIEQGTFDFGPEPEYTINYNKYVKEIKRISKTYSAVTPKLLNDHILRKLSRKIESIIEYISRIIGKTGNRTDIQTYEFAINDIAVEYVDYNDASVYLSTEYTNPNSIESIALYDTSPIPTFSNNNIDYATSHSIMIGPDFEIPIMPINHTTYTHVAVIKNKDITSYKLPFIADLAANVVVTINSQEYLGYTMNKISDTLATGVTISGQLNDNDILAIKYTPAKKDILNRTINPKRINLDELSRPDINNKNAMNNRYIPRILLKHTDDTVVSYELGTEANAAKIPFPSGDFPGFILNGVKVDTNLPEYVQLASGTIGVNEDDTIAPLRTVYYGILDEVQGIPSITTDTVFQTDNAYVPSSLFIYKKDDMTIVDYDEYDLDTASSIETKREFTIHASVDYPVSGDVLIQYSPVTFDNAESNIALFNILEEFTSTAEEDKIKIQHKPHTDNKILSSLTETPQAWSEGDGIWIFNYNNSVVYKPIDITINGNPAIDRTQYTTTHKPTMNAFDENIGNYEYIVLGNEIKFNTAIEDKTIAVSYYLNNEAIRLKSRMYRLNRQTSDKTPFMQHAALLINVKERGY
jgi:hypothetical protein